MAAQAERTGVMVVRLWIEANGGGLRARLTKTDDITRQEHTTVAAANAAEVVEIVREWVEAFAADG